MYSGYHIRLVQFGLRAILRWQLQGTALSPSMQMHMVAFGWFLEKRLEGALARLSDMSFSFLSL